LKLNRCIITGIANASKANKKAGNRKLIFNLMYRFIFLNKHEQLHLSEAKIRKQDRLSAITNFCLLKIVFTVPTIFSVDYNL